MSIKAIVSRCSETLNIKVPSTTVTDKYGQYTYTDSTVKGRLVQSEEEVVLSNGETVVSKAKLYTLTELNRNTKIGDYKIFSSKACKNLNNTVIFYKYLIG